MATDAPATEMEKQESKQESKPESKPESAVVAEKLVTDSGASDTSEEEAPKLHAKTWLAVFAVCLIYFTQLVNLVGAGAVRSSCLPCVYRNTVTN
jgi:hypothetical protein